MATYSPAMVRVLAQRLCHDLPGLYQQVAECWINAEQGVNNNPLGVTAGGVLVHYPNPIAGIDAAAARVRTSIHYGGIRASLSGSVRDQALAIIASPWNFPGSPYYTRRFNECGLLTSSVGDAQDNFYDSLDPHQLHLLHLGDRVAFQASLSPHQLHLQHLMNLE